jgi:hypothetical protein
MADENMGEEQEVEAPTTDNPESESTEEETEVDQPLEESEEQESPETETGKNEDGNVPKDNAAWAAMRAENKRLKESLDEIDPEYIEKLRGATGPQNYQSPQVAPVTEDADYSDVTNRVNWTQNQVVQARQENAQLRQLLELQQDTQAEDAYPELKTDKQFQQIVAEKKLAARVLGHDRTTMQIAKEVRGLLTKRDEQTSVKAAEETKQQMIERQAATVEPKGKTSGGKSAIASEELRDKVRRGDSAAAEEMAKGLITDLEF